MWFFDWFRKTSIGEKHLELHRAESKFRQVMLESIDKKLELVAAKIKDITSRVDSLEKKAIGGIHEGAHVSMTRAIRHLQESAARYEGILADVIAKQKDQQQSTVFQSGKSHLASDEVENPGKYVETSTTYSPVADGIKFEGEKGISYVVGLIAERDKYKKLLESQHRMINRLYKLAATSVEDPGKSITEDLRKAEKWKATLNRKFKALKED